MVSGGMSCVKYLLFAFNLLFAISGIAILTVGAVIQSVYSKYLPFVEVQFFVGPLLLIVIGVVIFIVAFFGCCGAVKENHCMIISYSVFLMLVFIGELGCGIAGYVMRDDVKNMLDGTLNTTLAQYGKNTEITKTWDFVQYDLTCCGIYNYTDWKTVLGPDTLPKTCCPTDKGDDECDVPSAYKDGCLTKLSTKIEKEAIYLGIAGLGIAFIQLFGVAFACCLARSIRQEYETV